MKILFKLFGVFYIIVGIFLLIKPELLFDWIGNNVESTSLYIGAIVGRILIGTLFIYEAKSSKHPAIIKSLGFITILAALFFLITGHESFIKTMAAMLTEFKSYATISALLCVLVGCFLVYSFSESKK